jgi:hypothetical protein
LVFAICLNSSLAVLSYSFLKEVGLALERDHLHPFKGVLDFVNLWHFEGEEETVGHKLDVLVHQVRVHTYELDGQGFRNEALLYFDCIGHYLLYARVWKFVLQVGVNEAGKVCVHSFVAADQLVRECKARHQSSLFYPVNCAEAPAKEDALDARECHQSLGERALVSYPLQGPLGLLFDAGYVLEGVEKKLFLLFVGDQRFDQKGVSFGVYVFHHHLKSVKTPCLGHLDFARKPLG